MDDLSKLTKKQLLDECAKLPLTGKYKSKNKSELITLIQNHKNANPNIPINKKLTVIDLFCGCGGFSTGFVQSGYFEIVAAIDIWDAAINTYRQNHDEKTTKIITADLTKFGPEKLDITGHMGAAPIDIIIGGPPCQGMSLGGRRDINDPRNSLFMEFCKYIKYFSPKMFLMENVMGLLSMKINIDVNMNTNANECAANANGGAATSTELVPDIIMREFAALGYTTHIAKLYASDYGVPQNRRRVIFIGVRADLGITAADPPKTIPDVKQRIAVGTVLEPREIIPQSYYLSAVALAGIAAKKQKSAAAKKGFGAQFLDLTKPSFTIPSRYYKDGYDALVKYSETEVRRLMPRELARIQSFPEDYKFVGSTKEIIMQIGNAVPVLFAYHLAKYAKSLLDGVVIPDDIHPHEQKIQHEPRIPQEQQIPDGKKEI